jgi:hypothetical protein
MQEGAGAQAQAVREEGKRQARSEIVREEKRGEVKMPGRLTSPGLAAFFLLLMALAVSGFSALSAFAADAPAWNITSEALPTDFTPNGTGIVVEETNVHTRGNTLRWEARNLGDTAISGAVSPITLAVSLGGVSSVGISGAECKQPAGPCVFTGVLAPGQSLTVTATIKTGASGTGSSSATVTGGEAAGQPLAPATVNQPLTISSEPAPFGPEQSSVLAEFVNRDGGPETQAGAHPYNLSISFRLNTKLVLNAFGGKRYSPSADVKDIAVELPPGVVGNELALGQCTTPVLEVHRCQGASQLGGIHPTIAGGPGLGRYALFNLKPDNGHTNELGFNTNTGIVVHMPAVVRTGGDYGITSLTSHLPNATGSIMSAEVQVWGVPADPSHTPERVLAGYTTRIEHGSPQAEEEGGGHPSPLPPTPFFTMPSSCGGPLVFKFVVDSYVDPGRVLPDGEPDLTDSAWKQYSVSQPGMSGCEKLQSFTPHVTVVPASSFADTPTGTTVEVSVPQGEGLTAPTALATSTLQNTKVILPAGLVVSPGQANGLGACQASEDGVGTTGPPSCPLSTKVGTVQIETPLLPDKLEGNVYVLQSNPPNLQLLVAASADEVNLKLVGQVHLDEATGQLTSTFSGTPQLPFTHFRLVFSGGAQAALTTPPSCGVYATMADFTPWSSPATPDFLSANAFSLTAGPGGSPCSSPLPFAPTLSAGDTTDQAGGYTGFSMLLSRGDGQQRIEGLQFKAPPGLSGVLASVRLCEEPLAAQGACSAGSQIGHTIVGAGAGPAPLYIPEAGQPPAPIYLTGPYRGAPFGLSIVVPVIAGPFNLGTVVVRAAISIDAHTGQIVVTTDALPQVLAGVPTDLRQINAVIDRGGFMINPTNCSPMAFSGTAQSAQGATAPLSTPFQVGSCRQLAFAPKITVATSGKISKAIGANLRFKIAYPPHALGSQSWFREAKFDLPKQLPARLSTLQKACLESVFEANPAACPPASLIGHAVVHTELLPVALVGPVYFVSYGGAKFPDAVVVLQGDGVSVKLTGETFINHRTGITSATFPSTPDVPFESIEVLLPQGPFSEFGVNLPPHARYTFCGRKLLMPTFFKAQNGLEIRQNTPVAVTGCGKAKASNTRAMKAGRARKANTGRGRAGR